MQCGTRDDSVGEGEDLLFSGTEGDELLGEKGEREERKLKGRDTALMVHWE